MVYAPAPWEVFAITTRASKRTDCPAATASRETVSPAVLEAQAVATVPDEEAYDETVHEVYQKGYKMGKKVLRAAMVTVTRVSVESPLMR